MHKLGCGVGYMKNISLVITWNSERYIVCGSAFRPQSSATVSNSLIYTFLVDFENTSISSICQGIIKRFNLSLLVPPIYKHQA